jgi:hypothetical protein
MTTFGKTVQDHLDTSNIQHLAPALSQISFGELIAGMIPRQRVYAGLTSAAAQVLNSELDGSGDNQAGMILQVNDSSDTPLSIITSGAVGAGECKVEYSSEGVPTLTFNAAVTGFKVLCTLLPASLATNLAIRM